MEDGIEFTKYDREAKLMYREIENKKRSIRARKDEIGIQISYKNIEEKLQNE